MINMTIEKYEYNIQLNEILHTKQSNHIKEDRKYRLEVAEKLLLKNDKIIGTFLVDKNHPNGKEIHCVTKSGLIFILNEKKFKMHKNALITILIAREKQVERLMYACGMFTPEITLKKM